MRQSVPVGVTLALWLAALSGCEDGQGPAASVVLRTDSTEVTLTTLPSQPPKSMRIHLLNEGPRSVTVRMCNNGGFPGPSLMLQERGADRSWATGPWVTCVDPTDGFDLVIPANEEVPIARLLAAPYPGEFRYKLTYIGSDARTAIATSNVFIAH